MPIQSPLGPDTPLAGAATRQFGLPCRILIAIDGSAPSKWAVEFGGRLAEALSARVQLLHVVEPVTRVANELVYATPALQEEHCELCRHARELLEKAQATLPESVQFETVYREGSPVAEIIHLARTWEASLIIMGTRGRGRLTQFLLGSVAEAVIRKAECPILTIGHEPLGTNQLRRCDRTSIERVVSGTS